VLPNFQNEPPFIPPLKATAPQKPQKTGEFGANREKFLESPWLKFVQFRVGFAQDLTGGKGTG
jgi:hypothetical protein